MFSSHPLPIDALLPDITCALSSASTLIIEAAPGAGKTSRVPLFLLGQVHGEVLVLEPRRVAARLAAERAAKDLGEEVGQTVGFQVRFESSGGAETRLRFLTEGVFTRRLVSDPDLRGVEVVVLDEFHERHLETDFALALVRRLQERRPELKLVLMSATLETGALSALLGNCPILRAAGRQYALDVRHSPYSPAPLATQVRDALQTVLLEQNDGNVLVFLPGAAEIHRSIRECGQLAQAHGITLLPLYGDLAPDQQNLALKPGGERSVIFATNIAETSITIENVTTVIDSGLARSAAYSIWTGIATSQVGRVSKASAKQRAGRAGRTAPGTAIRLYPLEDYAQRPEHEAPEILRMDLAGLCLMLRAMGGMQARDLAWLDPPPEKAVEHANNLLDLLDIDSGTAQKLSRLPVPPRLARMLAEAEKLKVLPQAIQVAALLSSGCHPIATDLLEALDEPAGHVTQRIERQLNRVLKPRAADTNEASLLKSVLAAFPDRVAQRRNQDQVLLANGVTAEVRSGGVPYPYMTILEVETRSQQAPPEVRLIARVEPEWILDCFPDRIREETVCEWNAAAERVEAVEGLRYGALTLIESRHQDPDLESAASMLAEKAVQVGLDRFIPAEASRHLLARIKFASLPLPDLEAAILRLCQGLRSFSELEKASRGLLTSIEASYGDRLLQWAPNDFRLAAGRTVKVHYEDGKPPWIASRLQDFFGMSEAPALGPQKTRAVLHLLAPNQRAVQTTSDLAGFWQRLYPELRRELARRYPRHAWPDDPSKPGTG